MMDRVLTGSLLLLLTTNAFCQAADAPDAAVEIARQERLKHITERADSVELRTADEKPRGLKRLDRPVLRYTNPIRSSSAGGATFLWLDGQRPLAAASISIRDNNNVVWEFTSLANERLSASHDDEVFWTPKGPGRRMELLPDSPAPAATPALRLAQLRTLARRFSVFVEKGKWQETRLLSQPLHRWDRPEAGILDGALFCFAETTDPEVLLLIEARRDEITNKHEWHFTIAKMSGPTTKVELDQKPLWNSGGGYWRSPRSLEDSYMESVIGTYSKDATTN